MVGLLLATELEGDKNSLGEEFPSQTEKWMVVVLMGIGV